MCPRQTSLRKTYFALFIFDLFPLVPKFLFKKVVQEEIGSPRIGAGAKDEVNEEERGLIEGQKKKENENEAEFINSKKEEKSKKATNGKQLLVVVNQQKMQQIRKGVNKLN